MRLLVLILLAIFAFGHDQNQLNIQAKVFEKTLLLDSKIEEKLSSANNAKIVILYDESEEMDAIRLKRYLVDHAKNDPLLKSIKIRLIKYKEFNQERALAYYFLESSDKESVHAIAAYAVKSGIITYSYNPDYLAYGVMLSLKIEQKTYPVINPEAILESGIKFKPILIRISKRYIK